MRSADPRSLRRNPQTLGFWALGVFLLLPLPLFGQTVRPVIAEHQGKARSKFELVNDSLFPLNVVLEPKGFSISVNGEAIFRPLDSSIHLKLSAMSFRIPPRQSRFVFYEARADALPAWFVIYSTFAGFPVQSGLNVQVVLPHTVYLLQKEPLDSSHVRLRLAEFQPEARRVVVELENTGPYLGRAREAEVISTAEKTTSPGFPLLPHSERRLEIPWEAAESPEKVVIRFKGFVVEERLQERKHAVPPTL